MPSYKKKIRKRDMPKDFDQNTVDAINRIVRCHNVVGVLFLRNGVSQMYTLPETLAQVISAKLPPLTSAMHRAVTELDIQNDLIAFRLETKKVEIVVAADREFAACVVYRINKKKHKKSHKTAVQK